MRWFRIYDDAVDDEKLGLLSDSAFRGWFNLLCMASKNGGVLPEPRVLAYKLRKTQEEIAALIDELCRERLLDAVEIDGARSFAPHNWDTRQFKSDTDSTAAERKRRERERNRDKKRGVTASSKDVTRDDTHQSHPSESESESESEVVVAADARASGSKVSQEAFDLADELLVIAGHRIEFVPPGWCGAPMRVQSWLNSGWTRDQIVPAVTAATVRKRGPPAYSVQFFEKAIAEEVARQRTPMPIVEVREAQKITVNDERNETNRGKPARRTFAVLATELRRGLEGSVTAAPASDFEP